MKTIRTKTLKILFYLIPEIESRENLDKTISNFLEMVYHLQIIQEDFDWTSWEEGKQILQNSDKGFDKYDIDTLCKLITAIVRNDKFNENYLESKFTDGTIFKIIKAMENKNKTLFEFLEERISDKIQVYEYEHVKLKKTLTFNGLFNAYENYEWNGIKKEETTENLNRLKVDIVSNKKTAYEEILKWGNVYSKWNKIKLEKVFKEGEKKYFERVSRIVSRFNINQPFKEFKEAWDADVIKGEIFMNSGFTKIYSLYFDDFVIYDSRVGAALAFFVNEYIEKGGELAKDDRHRFSIPPSRDNKRRNPEGRFNIIGQDPAKFFYNNLVANHLIKSVLENTKSDFKNINSVSERMRALEMALFMIGYDVKKIKENYNK